MSRISARPTQFRRPRVSSVAPVIKDYAAGIVGLLPALDTTHRIGDISAHEWLNPRVDGMRVRVGWKDIETGDGVFNWSLIDECFAHADTSGKWIGLGLIAGVSCPPHLVGLGAAYRDLAAGEGRLFVPWDPIFQDRWPRMIGELGNRYDGNPLLRYAPMGGLGRTGEAHMCSDSADVAFFHANAIAAGFVDAGPEKAESVAWESSTNAIITAYDAAFPTTEYILTHGSVFPPSGSGGAAIDNVVAAACPAHPGRFGLMASILNAQSDPTDDDLINIFTNYATNPTGIQFLFNSQGVCNACRLSRCDGTTLGCNNYGTFPCLTSTDAFTASLANAVTCKCRYVEVYEADLRDTDYEPILDFYSPLLKAI